MIRGILILFVLFILMFSLTNIGIKSKREINKNKQDIQLLTEIIIDAGLWPADMSPIGEKKK